MNSSDTTCTFSNQHQDGAPNDLLYFKTLDMEKDKKISLLAHRTREIVASTKQQLEEVKQQKDKLAENLVAAGARIVLLEDICRDLKSQLIQRDTQLRELQCLVDRATSVLQNVKAEVAKRDSEICALRTLMNRIQLEHEAEIARWNCRYAEAIAQRDASSGAHPMPDNDGTHPLASQHDANSHVSNTSLCASQSITQSAHPNNGGEPPKQLSRGLRRSFRNSITVCNNSNVECIDQLQIATSHNSAMVRIPRETLVQVLQITTAMRGYIERFKEQLREDLWQRKAAAATAIERLRRGLADIDRTAKVLEERHVAPISMRGIAANVEGSIDYLLLSERETERVLSKIGVDMRAPSAEKVHESPTPSHRRNGALNSAPAGPAMSVGLRRLSAGNESAVGADQQGTLVKHWDNTLLAALRRVHELIAAV